MQAVRARGAVPASASGASRASHGGAPGFGASSPQPSQGQKPKGKGPWRVVFWVALVVFAISVAALGYIGYTYWQGQRGYDEIANEAFTAPETTSLADFQVDWEALRAINPDVVGWIYVPGTDVNYPIAWREDDDSYYLKHNFNGYTSAQFGAEYGSIMLSGVNSGDFSDEVNIIYGHNLANGSMFAPLAKFADAEVFNSHRTVYLLTPQGNYLLRTFAIVHVLGSSTDVVIPNFATDAERTEYLQNKLDNSLVAADPAGSAAADIEQAFALVTCDGSNNTYRYITYCEVADFYALGSADGADSGAQGSGFEVADKSAVSEDDVSNVGGAAAERTS